MSDPRFKTGYRADSVPRRRSGHQYIAGRFATAQESASMYQFRGPQLWQSDYGMCFPMSITRATYAQQAAKGLLPKLVSPVFGYAAARAQEFAYLPREQ